jgi:putative ABC transport system permease protein
MSIDSLTANKLRSFLATLGIIIGVGAVISMLALAAGARQEVMKKVEDMGSNLLVVQPARPKVRGLRSTLKKTLELDDARALLAEVEGIAAVAPQSRGAGQVKYYNENTNVAITGTTVTYFPALNYEFSEGKSFTEREAEMMANYAVIGSEVKTTLFKDKDAVGETIKVKGINFTVVGVLKEKGTQGHFNPNEVIIIPLELAMKQLNGKDYLDEIAIQANAREDLSSIEKKISALLRKRHKLAPNAENDFEVRNQAEMIDMASSVTDTFTILVASIAAISLLVGGIGIMNIMLVTVTERTREIGIRKAIGARRADILNQFLMEAIVVSGFGGIMGVFAGIGAAKVIDRFTTFVPVIELSSVMLALFVSVSIGIFFGYYPARRAAQLNTIDALRYE